MKDLFLAISNWFGQFGRADWIQIFVGTGAWLAAAATFLAVRVSLNLAKRAEYVANRITLQNISHYSAPNAVRNYSGEVILNVGPGTAVLLPMYFFYKGKFIGTNRHGEHQEFYSAFSAAGGLMVISSHFTLNAGDDFLVANIKDNWHNTPQAKYMLEVFLKELKYLVPHYGLDEKLYIAAYGAWNSEEEKQEAIKNYKVRENSSELMKASLVDRA